MLADVNGFVVSAGIYTVELNTFVYPLNDLDISLPDIRQENNPKMQQDGEWPGYQRLSGMDIHIEGDIFGVDSADYFANRKALTDLFRKGNIGVDTPNAWNVAIIFLGLDVDDVWQTNATRVDFAAPVGGASPSRSPFTATFHCSDPYFIDAADQQQFYS